MKASYFFYIFFVCELVYNIFSDTVGDKLYNLAFAIIFLIFADKFEILEHIDSKKEKKHD